ncbi:MAG: GAF domain-containing protein [Calditrichaeota bacterium]|nr:GAF domain-containing protein [Calditrichota bacterium]HQU73422.1 GAF domain-containing protein [Calditrichia bacterium]
MDGVGVNNGAGPHFVPHLRSAYEAQLPENWSTRHAFKKLCGAVRHALQAYICLIAQFDSRQLFLKILAGASVDAEGRHLVSLLSYAPIPVNPRRHPGNYQALSRGQALCLENLDKDAQGILNPRRIRELGLRTMIAHPVRTSGHHAYLVLYYQEDKKLGEDEHHLLEVFGTHILAIASQNRRADRLRTFRNIVEALPRELPANITQDYLPRIKTAACTLLDGDRCNVWLLNPQERRFTSNRPFSTEPQVSLEGKDFEVMRRFCLDGNSHYFLRKLDEGPLLPSTREAVKRGAQTVLTVPMKAGNNHTGFIEIVWHREKRLDDLDQHLLRSFSLHAALMWSQSDHQKTFRNINAILQDMIEAEKTSEFLALLLPRIRDLVDFDFGWISLLNTRTNKLDIAETIGEGEYKRDVLFYGEGISGLALKEMRPIMVEDVREEKWQDIYVEYDSRTRSEMAIPIIAQNSRVRIDTRISFRPKKLGVINLESFQKKNFTAHHRELLMILARHVAACFERLVSLEHLEQMHDLVKSLVGIRDWDKIFRTVVSAITDAFGFVHVNISLVNQDSQTISTKYVNGLSEEEEKEFKAMATHKLDSEDIQAYVYRTREVIVPEEGDKRFDQDIYQRFGHDKLIRVLVPMILPSEDRVIGTVEVGYLRENTPYIYEREIRMLRSFIDYSVLALQQGNRGMLEVISHEIANAVAGIRNNTDFLKRRHTRLPQELIERKLDDVLLDAYLLIRQVKKITYMLGAPQPPSQIKETLLFRDVVIKTIKQLINFISEQGHNPQNVHYHGDDKYKIPPLFLDPVKLNEVVFNLVINAIKYAKPGKSGFELEISAFEEGDFYVLAFADQGIGIEPQYTAKVFETGFRAPSAIVRNVSGSGLGLSISKHIMADIGGDLILDNNASPTVFKILLPKYLREAGHDSAH